MSCGCSGPYERGKLEARDQALSPNPTVRGGDAVIFLGSGDVTKRGLPSGLEYHVSEHRRQLTVHADDTSGLLKDRRFIRKPGR